LSLSEQGKRGKTKGVAKREIKALDGIVVGSSRSGDLRTSVNTATAKLTRIIGERFYIYAARKPGDDKDFQILRR